MCAIFAHDVCQYRLDKLLMDGPTGISAYCSSHPIPQRQPQLKRRILVPPHDHGSSHHSAGSLPSNDTDSSASRVAMLDNPSLQPPLQTVPVLASLVPQFRVAQDITSPRLDALTLTGHRARCGNNVKPPHLPITLSVHGSLGGASQPIARRAGRRYLDTQSSLSPTEL